MTGPQMAPMAPMALMSDEEVAGYGRDEDAGFGALRTERGLLPLVALQVDARVVGVIATIDVAQTFVNTLGVPIEATYIFPLPDRAAVHRFQMEVAGRVIDGVIDERGAARASYDRAIAAGHRAAITEEERPGVFTLRVGNLMPGERATVRLALVGPLAVDDGEVTFRFPLVVAPRYIPGGKLGGDQAGLGIATDTDAVPDASRISPPVRLPGCPNPVRLAIRVALEDGVVRDVVSSLHAVTQRRQDAQIIEVQPGERLDRDFLLRLRIDGAALQSTLVCVGDPHGGGTFALTVVPPSTTAVAARPRDVVFVLDRSGSMEGWKMVAARRAVARMIDTLTSRDRFSAIAFDDFVEELAGRGLVAASDRNRFRAVEALAKVESRGGTELTAPLRKALDLLAGGAAEREHVIVVVTDGQVGNEPQILAEVAPRLRNIKMFTLGIDRAVNAAFLRQLAAAGGGLCELVESEDRLDEVMTKVHRRIGTPIATELAIAGRGIELDRATVSPAKLPDAYAGAPVVVLGRYRGVVAAGAAIDVETTSLGEPLRLAVPALQVAPASWLAASWARAHLRDLEDQYAAGRTDLESKIVQISKQFGVLSRFTAFVAIDRSQVVNAGGVLHQAVQSVEPPSGWETRGAPSAPLRVMAIASAPMRKSFGGPPMTGGMASAPRGPDASPPGGYAGGMPRMRAQELDDGATCDGAPDDLEERAELREIASFAPPPSFVLATPSVAPPTPSPAVASAYLAQLARLAVDLEREAGNPTAIRLLRQRLAQWIEDVRSTGASALADEVERLIARLSAALDAGAATEIAELARQLALLASGATPPTTTRRAFWK